MTPSGQRPSPPRDEPSGPASEPAPATRAWALMAQFVHHHDPTEQLRVTLGLGRGTGRIRTLMCLESGPLGVAEVARRLGADPPYATLIVNELEALGLLARQPDPTDRRRKSVELTRAGRSAVTKAREVIERPPQPLAALSAVQLSGLIELLNRLAPGDTAE